MRFWLQRAEYFELPIAAAEVYKLTKDSDYASKVWTWVKHIIDDIDANLIDSGIFEGCFNWNHINDEATYEAWWLFAPNAQKGTQCVSTAGTLWIARAYEQAAVIAEAVGEGSIAADYRSKAEKMRDKVCSLLWNPSARQYWGYWSDAEGYVMGAMVESVGGNNYEFIRGVPGVAGYIDDRIRESVLLHHYNLINLEKDPSLTDNYLPSNASSDWMLGKAEPVGEGNTKKILDSYFWGVVFSCVKLGLDDLFEHWLNVIADEYDAQGSFLFDEWSNWDGTPSSNYPMRRTMGMLVETWL